MSAPAAGGDEALLQPATGAWTRGLDVVLALLPIAALVFTTVSRRFYMRTSRSLPLAALAMWFLRLAYSKLEVNYTNAAIIYGLLDALTPLSIIAGAITLFQAMEKTKVRSQRWLKTFFCRSYQSCASVCQPP